MRKCQVFNLLIYLTTSDLMGPAYEVQFMSVKEFADYFCSEGEGNTSFILAPGRHLFIWV